MKFFADCHLGKVAKYLRIFGFDTLYFQTIEDDEIINIANKENRIVLTSDKELYLRIKKKALYIYHGKFEEQLRAIFKHFDLYKEIKPFSICIECNGKLEKVPKNEVIDNIELKTQIFHDNFERCTKCGKIYWKGDHFKRMKAFVDSFLEK